MTATAGSLDTRIRIERRGADRDDGHGNVLEAWEPVATFWASWRPEFGREVIAAGRPQSTRHGVAAFRRSTVTAGITAADRLVFVTGPEAGAVADVRAIVPTAETIEITAEIGAAT